MPDLKTVPITDGPDGKVASVAFDVHVRPHILDRDGEEMTIVQCNDAMTGTATVDDRKCATIVLMRRGSGAGLSWYLDAEGARRQAGLLTRIADWLDANNGETRQ